RERSQLPALYRSSNRVLVVGILETAHWALLACADASAADRTISATWDVFGREICRHSATRDNCRITAKERVVLENSSVKTAIVHWSFLFCPSLPRFN